MQQPSTGMSEFKSLDLISVYETRPIAATIQSYYLVYFGLMRVNIVHNELDECMPFNLELESEQSNREYRVILIISVGRVSSEIIQLSSCYKK